MPGVCRSARASPGSPGSGLRAVPLVPLGVLAPLLVLDLLPGALALLRRGLRRRRGVRSSLTRILDRRSRGLGLVLEAPGSLGDPLQLLGVALEALGPASLVDQVLRLGSHPLQVHLIP